MKPILLRKKSGAYKPPETELQTLTEERKDPENELKQDTSRGLLITAIVLFILALLFSVGVAGLSIYNTVIVETQVVQMIQLLNSPNSGLQIIVDGTTMSSTRQSSAESCGRGRPPRRRRAGSCAPPAGQSQSTATTSSPRASRPSATPRWWCRPALVCSISTRCTSASTWPPATARSSTSGIGHELLPLYPDKAPARLGGKARAS